MKIKFPVCEFCGEPECSMCKVCRRFTCKECVQYDTAPDYRYTPDGLDNDMQPKIELIGCRHEKFQPIQSTGWLVD